MLLSCQSVDFSKLKICLSRNNFDGHWAFKELNESSDPSVRCPVLTNISQYKSVRYQCDNYRAAMFVPHNCRLRSFDTSIRIMSEIYPRGSVVYVGDSLTSQHHIAALCDREKLKTDMQFVFMSDLFFRRDLPCPNKCLTNATFREVHYNWYKTGQRFIDYCGGCPSGQIQDECVYVKDPSGTGGRYITPAEHWWETKIPTDAKVVILSTGAWYNMQHGLSNPLLEFRRTIFELTPVLSGAVKKGIAIAWMPIPLPTPGVKSPKHYNRDLFMAMNTIVKDNLPRIGVIYIDKLPQVLLNRKVTDRSVALDDLHWCNLGPTAVPSFSNQVYFHFISLHVEHILKNHPNNIGANSTTKTSCRVDHTNL